MLARTFDQVSKHVCSIFGVNGAGGWYIGVPGRLTSSRARETKGARVKGISASGEKPEKFIKRFLSRRRRTSVSDLLAPVRDPACPQEDSPDSSFGPGSRWRRYAGVQSFHGTLRCRISPLFARYPSELPSPPFPSGPLIDLHSIDGWTHPHSPLPRGSLAGWLALCLDLKTRRNRDNATCPLGSARRRSEGLKKRG